MTEDDLQNLPILYHYRLGRLIISLLSKIDDAVVRVAFSSTGDPLIIVTAFRNGKSHQVQRMFTMAELTSAVTDVDQLWADILIGEMKDAIKGKRD